MSNTHTHTYKVTDLQRDKDGIVISASFTITASDGTDSNTHNYHTAFTAPKGTPIDYAQVTEVDVIGWVKTMFDTKDDDGVRQNELEDQADAELAAFKKRSQLQFGTPWSIYA